MPSKSIVQLGHGTQPCLPSRKPVTDNHSSHADPDQATGGSYPYRRLEHGNSIRLLLITPASGERVIYTLLHAELGDVPYKALSYEWGLPSDDDPDIIIDGHTVKIRKNLSEALKQISSVIRYVGFLFLWIDAICINQSDDAEKSHQVQKMGRIFSEAEQVFAWTGPEADDSDYAMDMLNSTPPSYSILPMHPELANNSRAQTAILAWCNRPYWRRVWIMQEIFLAKRLVFMCGSKSIAESALRVCFSIINGMKQSYSSTGTLNDSGEYWWIMISSSALYERIWGNLDTPPRIRTLLDWLYVCAVGEIMATDPRDYIYALLSISQEPRSGLVQIIPDYTKSPATVFDETNTLMMNLKERERFAIPGYTIAITVVVNVWLKTKLGLDTKFG